MALNDLAEPITHFLSATQASRLTATAAQLTKEGMLNAMHSYASGGQLVGNLAKTDILSVRDAFRERQTAVGADASGGGSCCCCCAATDYPSQVGSLRMSSVSDVTRTFAMAADTDGTGGGSCCCCCV